MVLQKKISFGLMVFVLSALACGSLQQSTDVSIPSDTPTMVPTIEPTATLLPTSTLPPTNIPATTTTPTQIQKDIAPFKFVTSLEGLPVDSAGNVKVFAPADGSVWIITGQAAMRWDGQAWEVVLEVSEGVLAAVDDGGRLWVLRQDTSEISTWQGGQWMSYGTNRG